MNELLLWMKLLYKGPYYDRDVQSILGGYGSQCSSSTSSGSVDDVLIQQQTNIVDETVLCLVWIEGL